MTLSLGHLPSEAYPLYDHRFFHYDKGHLRCFCGFAEDALRHMLYNKRKELYVEQLKDLCTDANNLYAMNPSVRGFAFEELVLAMLSINYHLLLREQFEGIEGSHPDIDVTVFNGDYREGIKLYRPNKWNLRYVDAVVRAYIPRKGVLCYALMYRY